MLPEEKKSCGHAYRVGRVSLYRVAHSTQPSMYHSYVPADDQPVVLAVGQSGAATLGGLPAPHRYANFTIGDDVKGWTREGERVTYCRIGFREEPSEEILIEDYGIVLADLTLID